MDPFLLPQLEYDNIEGMILLSELSRRRIRSIQKLIRVGRNEVVVVMRVDKEKGEPALFFLRGAGSALGGNCWQREGRTVVMKLRRKDRETWEGRGSMGS